MGLDVTPVDVETHTGMESPRSGHDLRLLVESHPVGTGDDGSWSCRFFGSSVNSIQPE